MSKGNTPLEHHTVTNEPHMLGKNGVIISRAEFARRCHIVMPYSDKRYYLHDNMTRVRGLYFGRHEDGITYKFRFRMYVEGGKKELLRRAYDAILLNSLGQGNAQQKYSIEIFDFNYNEKVSISV